MTKAKMANKYKMGFLKRMKLQATFLSNFFRNPFRMSSVTPSSRIASKKMFEDVDFSKIDVIVEMGPGLGEFTREYLQKIKPDTKVILFEVEQNFVNYLRKEFEKDVVVEHKSAHEMEEVLEKHGIQKVDLIVSGLPFALGDVFEDIKKVIKRQTDQGCVFRFFTYMPKKMEKHYQELPIEKLSYVFRNIPPMWIYGVN